MLLLTIIIRLSAAGDTCRRLCKNTSYTRHTANTVTPCSLLSNAATVKTPVSNRQTRFHSNGLSSVAKEESLDWLWIAFWLCWWLLWWPFDVTTWPLDVIVRAIRRCEHLSRNLQYFIYVNNANRKNIHANISARPTTPATASVCTGCDAKSSPAASTGRFWRNNTRAKCVNSPVAMACSTTFNKWYPSGSWPPRM